MHDTAVKAVAPDGTFTAQAIRYGSPSEPDRTGEFFTAKTELMMDQWSWPRPILLEHGAAPGTFGVVLGHWTGYETRADGVYLHGKLDTQHPMFLQIKRDIDAGRYYVSSDSAPHLVKKRPAASGTREITHWTWITGSLTTSPAEHRLLPVAAVKALALKAGARHSARDQRAIQDAHDSLVTAGATCGGTAKHVRDDRARRIRLEIELLAIEQEIER
jgi:hypothetical protein